MVVAKAYLLVEDGPIRIPCYYNPERLSMSRSNSWSEKKMPGRGVQRARYKGANAATMNLELKFDTTEEGVPVTAYTDLLLGLMEPDPLLSGADPLTGNVRPPTVTFCWGTMQSYESVIESMSLTYTYFSAEGLPLRAEATMALKQYQTPLPGTNPTSGTPNPHRVHRVQPGETLDRISARYYGDATKWRALANANGLEDPLSVRPGTVLAIPQLGGGA